MTLRCENCNAPYKGPISPYQKFFKCQYCGSITKIARDEPSGETRRIVVTETVVGPSKTFKICEFAAFLLKRGVKTFDPVSGILKLGSQEVCVSEEGAVDGPERLKLRVEKWVEEFMSS
jgi:hypothetical protein